MLTKISGLARILGVLLAIVAGIVALPGFDVMTALIILGAITGLVTKRENLANLLIAALALPLIGTVLGNLPAIGAQLGDIFGNLGTLVAGHAAVGIVIAVYKLVVDDLKGLGGSSS